MAITNNIPSINLLSIKDLMESSSYVCIWQYEGKTWSEAVRLEDGKLMMFDGYSEKWIKPEFEDEIQLYFMEIVWTTPN